MSGKYNAARQAFGEGSLSWTRDRIVAQLVSAEYQFNEDHATAAELIGAVGDPIELIGKSIDAGWARSARMIFAEVKGSLVIAIVFHRQILRGKSLPETLVMYADAIERFPMMPNGGDIEIDIPAPGIFRL